MRPTKFDVLADKLENMISGGEIAAGAQLPSQYEIVERFNVSRSCANKALDFLSQKGLITKVPGKGNFAFSSEEKPKKFKRLAYFIDDSMRRYRTGRDDFGLELMSGIEEECKKFKLSFVLRSLSTEEYPKSAIIAKELEVDGFIIRDTIPEYVARAISLLKIPVLYADRPCHAPGIGCVMINYHDAYMTLLAKLKDKGIRKAAFLYPGTSKYGEEIKYTVKSLKENNHDLHIADIDFSVQGMPYDANRDMEMVSASLKKLIREKSLPEIFVCNTDYIAEKLLLALKENGLRVPEDVQVVGGLGLDFAENTNPPLSTLHIDPELLGRKTVEVMHEMIAKGISEITERIPMHYKKRGTCTVLE